MVIPIPALALTLFGAGLIAIWPYLEPHIRLAINELVAIWGELGVLQRIRRLLNIRAMLSSWLATRQYQERAQITIEEAFAQSQAIGLTVQEAIRTLVPPLSFPTFKELSEVEEYYAFWGQLYTEGLITKEMIDRVYEHYLAERRRLLAIPPPKPLEEVVPPIPPVVISTPPAPSPVIDVSPIAQQIGALVPAITGALTGLGGILASALPMVGSVLATTLPGVGRSLGHELIHGRADSFRMTGFALFDRLIEASMPLALMVGMERFRPTRDFLNSLFERLWREILADPSLQAPIPPEKAPEVSRVLFFKAMEIGATAHFLSILGETFTPLKTLGLGYLSAFLADMGGFARLGGAMMGAIASQALITPFRYFLNLRVRTRLPDLSDLLRLAGEYALVDRNTFLALTKEPSTLKELDEANRREFARWLPYQGFSDEWIPKLYELSDTPARYFMLRAMADAGLWDEAYFIRELANSGYNIETIRHALDMLYAFAHGEIRGVFTSTAIKRFKEGLDDERKLQENLTMLGVRPGLLPKYVFAAKLEAEYDDVTDIISALKDALKKGLISPDDFELRLIELGIRPDKASILRAREEIKLFPFKPIKKPPKSP